MKSLEFMRRLSAIQKFANQGTFKAIFDPSFEDPETMFNRFHIQHKRNIVDFYDNISFSAKEHFVRYVENTP